MTADVFDVVIAGYGPTGLVAASLLAGRGHKVVVLERHHSLYGAPRVATIDGESARIIQAAGDWKAAFKNSVPRERYILANGEGRVLVDFDWSGMHVCGHPYRISVHQPDIEDAIDAAARAAGADIRQGWEVFATEQHDSHIEISARNRDGQSQTVRARFLIGADGARSTVRELLGLERESWPFRGAWLTVDCTRKRLLPNFLGQSPDGRIAAIFCAHSGRAHSIIPLGSDVIRINFQVAPDNDRTEVATREYAYRSLRQTYNLTEEDVEIFRVAVHVFEGKLTKTWRLGRALIAGDAAHAMTPFMGQGGCSAFRDAINISWKLDLVLSGAASESLLDTYEQERKPHARHFVDGSDKLGALAFTEDRLEAQVRDQKLINQPLAGRAPDPRIASGVLHCDKQGQPFGPAGELGPQGRVVWRNRHALFDDIAGWGFQILWNGAMPENLLRADQVEKLKLFNCTIAGFTSDGIDGTAKDIDGVYQRWFEAHGLNGILVRPDFVIHSGAFTASELQSRVDELLSQICAP